MSSSIVTREQVMGWSVDEDSSHLVEEGFTKAVVSLFKEKKVNGKALLALNTEEKLIELGVKSKSTRKAILTFLNSLSYCGALQYDPKAHGAVPMSCPDHPLLSSDLYCEECDKLVCSQCIKTSKHKGHKIVTSLEHVASVRKDLEECVTKLGEHSTHVEKVNSLFIFFFLTVIESNHNTIFKVLRECGSCMEKLTKSTALSIEEILTTKEKLIKLIEEVSEMAILQTRKFEAKNLTYLDNTIKMNIQFKKVNIYITFISCFGIVLILIISF